MFPEGRSVEINEMQPWCPDLPKAVLETTEKKRGKKAVPLSLVDDDEDDD